MRKRNCKICENCEKSFIRIGGQRWCEECDTPYFIKRAKQIHGDRYDYKYTNYSKARLKVKIICPEHGVFEQRPSSHLQGHGCWSCIGRKPYTTDEFIERAVEVHGNRYGYKDTNYINGKIKVKISCPEHGVFEQTPKSHLQGAGCFLCLHPKPYTNEEFIKKAVEVHGERYDYKDTKYFRSKFKVTIICPEHGGFEQSPQSHLQGNGCPSCAKLKTYTAEDFIRKAVEVHGERYGYDESNYINSRSMVIINCRFHGPFEQRAAGHLTGYGCPACGEVRKLTSDDFVRQALKVHGPRYDYSKVDYKNRFTKVQIGCKKHGFFEQVPNSHLNNSHGCPECGGSRRKTTEEFIEAAKRRHGNKYGYNKVGYVNGKTKVEIVCSIHGPFHQRARIHARGHGCPKCAIAIRAEKRRKS